MKTKTTYIILIFFAFSCSHIVYDANFLKGRIYESERGPLYIGSKIIFNRDETYKYLGQGPSVFLSEGKWTFDSKTNALVLQPETPREKFINPATFDTMWVDVTKFKVRVVSKTKISLNDVMFTFKGYVN